MRRRALLFGLSALLILGCWLCCLPRDLFEGTPYSTVVTDRDGRLLGARIAADGQWRFPPCDSVPATYAAALIRFEDRRFYRHPGVDPFAIGRALRDNFGAGRIRSGASTLTMQVIRLSRRRERTLWQKLVEAVLATRLEAHCSKAEILAMYASHAPFGGNVVGIDAAAWRYFGRPAGELSWAEAATLAVLPNAPSAIHPGRRRDRLLEKRNALLRDLRDAGYLSAGTCEDAIGEALPGAPHPLPSLARHLVDAQPEGKLTRTDIDATLQERVEAVVNRCSDELARSGAADMAAVVLDLADGSVRAYVGNSSPMRLRDGMDVDIAAAPRSTGSILKPFLYAAALEEGLILPESLLPDTPVNIGGFTPHNFDRQFHGAVPASEALARSLNVPAVHLLRLYGVPRFHQLLKDCGLGTLNRSSDDYGLSLILGGGEGSLLDITRAYAGFVRRPDGWPLTDDVAVWQTLEILSTVNRADEMDWRKIPSVRKAAWKTGTSYGYRDAWAVGLTPRWAVGVWCGNADGHGVPALTGASCAGPVLFELLNLLPEDGRWFEEPEGGMYADVCLASGFLRGPDCGDYRRRHLPARAEESPVCPYHRGGVFRLPPAMEWYYRKRHPEYNPPAPAPADGPAFIYPESGSVLRLPRQLDGSAGSAVFRAAHPTPQTRLWWHLDGEYLGETQLLHELRLAPPPGRHTLVVVDPQGRSASVSFTIAG
jgi:penicillin-binding protein 1C